MATPTAGSNYETPVGVAARLPSELRDQREQTATARAVTCDLPRARVSYEIVALLLASALIAQRQVGE